MLKSDLVDNLVRRFPTLTRKEIEVSVALILDSIQARLVAGGRFEVRDFGVLSTHVLPAKVGRNPRTGQAVFIKSRRVVHFRPGKRLRAWGAGQIVEPSELDCAHDPEAAIRTEVTRERSYHGAEERACGAP